MSQPKQNTGISRRHCLALGAGAAMSGMLGTSAASGSFRQYEPSTRPTPEQAGSNVESSVRYCLNTSTIRGQGLDLAAEVELVAKAGYDGIEPWIRELEAYEQSGGNLTDLGKRIADLGLTVENAIGFAVWIVDDEEARKKGREQAKRDMELLAKVGGKRIAAPPVGATNNVKVNLFAAAERYHELLNLGLETGVMPQLELWGFSSTLSRLGELIFVAVESNHAEAAILPDVYHIYKGGSEATGLRMIEPSRINVFHMNDYPAEPPRETISDAHRVYPGDGVAPVSEILADLIERGFQGTLSLELFNPEYWKQDAKEVAVTGLAKMKESVAKATEMIQ